MILTKEEKCLQNAVTAILFLFLSLITRFFPGLEGDMLCWKGWAVEVVKNLPDIYDYGSNYLPLYQYFLYLYGKLAGSAEAIHQNINYLRSGTLIFDFAGLWYVYKWIDKKISYLFILVFSMLNLSYIYNTVIWGQVDSIWAALAFISIYYAHQRKMVLSAILFTLALNTKLQAIIFLPVWGLLWIYTISGHQKVKMILLPLLSICTTQVLLLLPFMQHEGGLKKIWEVVFSSVDYYPKVSMNAYNFWYWFVANPYDAPDDAMFVAGMTYKRVGFLMFLISSFLVVLPLLYLTAKRFQHAKNIALHPSRQLLWIVCALLSLVFFFTNTQMHERYVHPAFIFLTVYTFHSRKWLTYILFSLAYFLNVERVLRAFRLHNYDTLIFDPRFIAGLFMLVISILAINLYKEFRRITKSSATANKNALCEEGKILSV